MWLRPARPTALALALLAVLAAALLAFGNLAEDYVQREAITRWDLHFAAWLSAHTSPALLGVFRVVTYAGDFIVLGPVTVVAAAVLFRRRAVAEAAVLVAGVLGVEALTAILKLAFHRPRPVLATIHVDSYSFPSGHAATSAAVSAVLLYLVARRRPMARRVVSCALVWVSFVVAIGFSRLYLGVHFLSDVLAGVTLGTAWAAICLLAFEQSSRLRSCPRCPGQTAR